MYAELSEIYEYAQLIPATKEIIKFCYAEEDLHIRNNWPELNPLILNLCEKIAKKNMNLANEIYSCFERACRFTTDPNSNYVLMGDELGDVIPLLYKGMLLLGELDVVEGGFEFFSSKSGFLTTRNIETQKIYHSTVDPMWEAFELAQRIYDSSFLEFYFLGCGLGYLPWQVFCQSDCSVDIYIFHTEECFIRYALNYGVLEWIPEEKLHIVVDKNLEKLVRRFLPREGKTDNIGRYIGEDVYERLESDVKDSMNGFMALNHTRTLWGSVPTINAYRNAFHVPEMISRYQPNTRSDEWILVAAGPSLDECIEYLRENVGKKTIICASTVLKKLLFNGIRPDGVAVLDPQARTWEHFKDLEDMSVPLLLNVTANWRFGEKYQGKKYLIPSLTDEITVRNYLLQGIEPWYIGSTVSTLMLEIAIHFQAKRIEMIGMDLAYPTGKSHATGTMDEKEISTAGMQLVPAVSGGTVPTTPQFRFYINEIERVIHNTQDIAFFNLSTKGALIMGASSVSVTPKG